MAKSLPASFESVLAALTNPTAFAQLPAEIRASIKAAVNAPVAQPGVSLKVQDTGIELSIDFAQALTNAHDSQTGTTVVFARGKQRMPFKHSDGRTVMFDYCLRTVAAKK